MASMADGQHVGWHVERSPGRVDQMVRLGRRALVAPFAFPGCALEDEGTHGQKSRVLKVLLVSAVWRITRARRRVVAPHDDRSVFVMNSTRLSSSNSSRCVPNHAVEAVRLTCLKAVLTTASVLPRHFSGVEIK